MFVRLPWVISLKPTGCGQQQQCHQQGCRQSVETRGGCAAPSAREHRGHPDEEGDTETSSGLLRMQSGRRRLRLHFPRNHEREHLQHRPDDRRHGIERDVVSFLPNFVKWLYIFLHKISITGVYEKSDKSQQKNPSWKNPTICLWAPLFKISLHLCKTPIQLILQSVRSRTAEVHLLDLQLANPIKYHQGAVK